MQKRLPNKGIEVKKKIRSTENLRHVELPDEIPNEGSLEQILDKFINKIDSIYQKVELHNHKNINSLDSVREDIPSDYCSIELLLKLLVEIRNNQDVE